MALLNTPRPVADYNCSQAELYSGLNSAWDSQAEREAAFIVENTKYTAGLSVTRKAAIQAAKAMPDGQARYADSESLRVDLTEELDSVLGKWNSLDGYIKGAFKGAHYKPRIEEAGKQYYETSAEKNWEDVSLLLEAGKTFITTHSAVLIADGGMPAGFAAAYDGVRVYDGLYTDFKDARQDAQEQTDAKLDANNDIYEAGREMMEDGKHIFRKNASVRERFTWDRILAMITPDTTGGGPSPDDFSIMGTVTDSVTGLPIDGAAVVVQSPEVIVLTNAQGKYLIPKRPAGTYTLFVHKDGYAEQSIGGIVVTDDAITIRDMVLVEEETGTIQGTVTKAGVGVAANITVEGMAGSITTDVNGNFAMADVVAGNQIVRATLTANPTETMAHPALVPANGSVTVDFVFP